jgi:hypothetical protein
VSHEANILTILLLMRRRRGESETAQRMAKFKRGAAVATRAIADKKLKGQLRHSEKLAAEAAYKAAKAEQWLLPEEGGTLEAEGLERTWRFSQVLLLFFPSQTTSTNRTTRHPAFCHGRL